MATLICGRMAQGKSLRKICESRRLPTITTVLDWVIKNPEFAKRYADAKKLRADWAAQKTIDVAEAATPETAAVARLQVDVYRWHASKLDTQAYGEKAAEMNVHNTVNNFTISLEQQRQIQDRRRAILEEPKELTDGR